ncbi:aKG-HExxH-type peptide beta-hydroxylase [Actinocrispum wychmicini]|uniref:HEXXH motif-containing protein n=1 Tax=Actinocrispum wychmicini TaxID=1213861 RepID=A0A4R2JBQ3_9PSEU|nr:HEXXH motif-containing putative peptide modification protein [Actinocrispum wychmicini]TCO53509.1 HEXXH motif-containing protein [Actinocrispum wychmicini]
MTPARHTLAMADFVALAHGGGGPRAIGTLVSARRSRTLLLLKYLREQAPAARPALDLLAEARRAAPQAVDEVLDHPFTGEWVTRTATLPDRGSALITYVAVAAAIRAGLSATVRVPPVDRMPLPSLGTVSGPVRGEVDVQGLEWAPTPRVTLSDGVSFELSPWPSGGPLSWLRTDDVDLGRWRERIGSGWDLLRRHHADVAAEFAAAIRMLTPLTAAPDGTSSATHADALGCVFLSLPPDTESVAVTLTHELQHNKLAALLDLFPLATGDQGATFYAPWRDEPRPLAGLLHGTYAHLGIAGFWRTQTAQGSAKAPLEFARWREAAVEAARALLADERLTDLGRIFVAGMIDVLAGWCAEPVPAQAVAAARQLSASHRSRWQAAHGQRSRPRT